MRLDPSGPSIGRGDADVNEERQQRHEESVALELAPVQALDGLDDEMRQVVFGQPVEQVGGQQERQVPVAGNELCRRATRFYFSL